MTLSCSSRFGLQVIAKIGETGVPNAQQLGLPGLVLRKNVTDRTLRVDTNIMYNG
jgi:hypothetical protein